MNTNNNFKLSIANACHENWDNMSKAEKGRFCGVCEKNVVDFTKMSEAEIINFFEEYKGGATQVCGRFKKTQLAQTYTRKDTTNYEGAKYSLSFLRRAAVGIGVIMALSQAPSSAFAAWQAPTTQVSRPNPTEEGLSLWERLTTHSRRIDGKVFDETGKPVAGAKVHLYMNGEEVAEVKTNKSGYYYFMLPKKAKEKDAFSINAAQSYRHAYAEASYGDFTKGKKIDLTLETYELMGEVYIEEK